MIQIFPRNLGAAGYIIILQLVIIGFFGLLYVGDQLQSIDIKNVVIQVNKSAEDTNTIIGSGNRTRILVDEIRNISSDISKNFTIAELSRQNQTRVFLPALQNSFENVEKIANISNDLRILLPNLTSSINNVTNATTFLAENFGPDTGYLERENFQYAQANKTADNINAIVNLLNRTN